MLFTFPEYLHLKVVTLLVCMCNVMDHPFGSEIKHFLSMIEMDILISGRTNNPCYYRLLVLFSNISSSLTSLLFTAGMQKKLQIQKHL